MLVESRAANIRSLVNDKVKHVELYFKQLKQQIVSMLDY